MLQKNTRCIKSRGVKTFEQDEDVQIVLILLKYHFFPFSTALRKQQKILACFPEDKLSTIYLDLQIQKGFTPRENIYTKEKCTIVPNSSMYYLSFIDVYLKRQMKYRLLYPISMWCILPLFFYSCILYCAVILCC